MVTTENSASSPAGVQVFSVPTGNRMFTTTHLSDHVHDHIKGWRFALMPPWAKAVGSAKAPQTTTTRQQDSHTYMVAEPVC